MEKKIKLLAVVPNESHKYTAYFFNKKTNYLLPIPLSTNCVESLILESNKLKLPSPHTHSTIKTIILALGATVDQMTLCSYRKNQFNTYIRLVKGNYKFEIDSNLSDAINIAFRFDCPIVVC